MKNFIKYLPVFLLFAYIILCFFRVPEFADSFVVLALSGLYGAFWWKEIHAEVALSIPREVEEEVATLRLKKEIAELTLKIDEMTISQDEKILFDRIRQLRKEREVIALEKDMSTMKSMQEGLGNEQGKAKYRF